MDVLDERLAPARRPPHLIRGRLGVPPCWLGQEQQQDNAPDTMKRGVVDNRHL